MTRKDFDRHVYQLCRKIPAGRVMTYGSLGEHIPPPADMNPISYDRIKARWVGYALKRCPDDVPWHRVVNARGEVSARPGYELQRALLKDEGVEFNRDGRTNLAHYLWKPSVQKGE